MHLKAVTEALKESKEIASDFALFQAKFKPKTIEFESAKRLIAHISLAAK